MSAVPGSLIDREKLPLVPSTTETCFPSLPLHCPPNTKASEYMSAHFLLDPPWASGWWPPLPETATSISLTSPPLPPLCWSLLPRPSCAGDPQGSVLRGSPFPSLPAILVCFPETLTFRAELILDSKSACPPFTGKMQIRKIEICSFPPN